MKKLKEIQRIYDENIRSSKKKQHTTYNYTQNRIGRGPLSSPVQRLLHSKQKGAWVLAVAMRATGHPLSAKLVIYSLLDWNYNEQNGDFATAIKKTRIYKNLKQERRTSGSSRFRSGDLFYAIHRFRYNIYGNGNMRISDIYDFELMNYRNLLLSIVNNYAYLSQNTGVLNPIHVNIKITNNN